MLIRLLLPFLFLCLHFCSPFAGVNVSHLLTYSLARHPDDPHYSPFLHEVLKVITEKQEWDLGAIRVSKLEKVRFGYAKRHTFSVGIGGKKHLVVKHSEPVDFWEKFDNESSSFEQLVDHVSSQAVLSPFLVDGPFLLLAHGGQDRLSLRLPMNNSLSGLRQIVVGEGVTLEIKGATELFLSLSLCNFMHSGGSYMKNKVGPNFFLLEQSLCPPLLPMRVAGSVYVTGFIRTNSGSIIEKTFVEKDIVELMLEKNEWNFYRKPPCPLYLSSRIVAVQHLLRNLLGERIDHHLNHSLTFHKANTKAMVFVQFQLELTRDLKANDSQLGKLPEWRTKPTVERVWFDILARVDSEKLKPVTVKQVKPFISVESSSWSYLLSNISLTEFSNILVPPHPLTLDVKW